MPEMPLEHAPGAQELTAEKLARDFHNTYEALAPHYGYDTRKDTREFDPTTANGRLMIAVCGHILDTHFAELAVMTAYADKLADALPGAIAEQYEMIE